MLLAASTVAVAMLGLYACGITYVGLLGLAAVFGVLTAAAGAVTLVPALLGLAGRRIDRYKTRRTPVAETGSAGDGWHRYAAAIGRRPWLFLGAGLAILCVLAIPLLSMQTGHVGDGADPGGYTDKQAYDLITEGFGPGYNGPFTIVVDVGHGASADTSLASHLQSDLAATSGVAKATPLTPTPDGALLVGTVIPSTGPQDRATTTLYNTLVNTTLPDALQGTGDQGYVTGLQAAQTEFDQIVTGRLPVIIAVVIAVAVFLSFVTSTNVVIKQLVGRPGRQHPHRRDHRPAPPGPVGHVPARHRLLVAAEMARPAPAPHRCPRRTRAAPGRRTGSPRGTSTCPERTRCHRLPADAGRWLVPWLPDARSCGGRPRPRPRRGDAPVRHTLLPLPPRPGRTGGDVDGGHPGRCGRPDASNEWEARRRAVGDEANATRDRRRAPQAPTARAVAVGNLIG